MFPTNYANLLQGNSLRVVSNPYQQPKPNPMPIISRPAPRPPVQNQAQPAHPNFLFQGTGRPPVGHGINWTFLNSTTPIPTTQVFTNLRPLPDFTTGPTRYNPTNRAGVHTGPAYFLPGGRPKQQSILA